jgi:hypothetical protein
VTPLVRRRQPSSCSSASSVARPAPAPSASWSLGSASASGASGGTSARGSDAASVGQVGSFPMALSSAYTRSRPQPRALAAAVPGELQAFQAQLAAAMAAAQERHQASAGAGAEAPVPPVVPLLLPRTAPRAWACAAAPAAAAGKQQTGAVAAPLGAAAPPRLPASAYPLPQRVLMPGPAPASRPSSAPEQECAQRYMAAWATLTRDATQGRPACRLVYVPAPDVRAWQPAAGAAAGSSAAVATAAASATAAISVLRCRSPPACEASQAPGSTQAARHMAMMSAVDCWEQMPAGPSSACTCTDDGSRRATRARGLSRASSSMATSVCSVPPSTIGSAARCSSAAGEAYAFEESATARHGGRSPASPHAARLQAWVSGVLKRKSARAAPPSPTPAMP